MSQHLVHMDLLIGLLCCSQGLFNPLKKNKSQKGTLSRRCAQAYLNDGLLVSSVTASCAPEPSHWPALLFRGPVQPPQTEKSQKAGGVPKLNWMMDCLYVPSSDDIKEAQEMQVLVIHVLLSFFFIKFLYIGWNPPFWRKYPNIPSFYDNTLLESTSWCKELLLEFTSTVNLTLIVRR